MAAMQVLCDSIGDDFPTFTQFVTMLRDYERGLVAPRLVTARGLDRFATFVSPAAYAALESGDFVAFERAARSQRTSRCVMVLPNGSRFRVESIESGMAAALRDRLAAGGLSAEDAAVLDGLAVKLEAMGADPEAPGV